MWIPGFVPDFKMSVDWRSTALNLGAVAGLCLAAIFLSWFFLIGAFFCFRKCMSGKTQLQKNAEKEARKERRREEERERRHEAEKERLREEQRSLYAAPVRDTNTTALALEHPPPISFPML